MGTGSEETVAPGSASTRTRWWSTTVAFRPLPSGTSREFATSTPPVGSTSFSSGSTSVSVPVVTVPRSSTATGWRFSASGSTTSMRISPREVVLPPLAPTVYSR